MVADHLSRRTLNYVAVESATSQRGSKTLKIFKEPPKGVFSQVSALSDGSFLPAMAVRKKPVRRAPKTEQDLVCINA